jgi:plasmid replication initiation protein
MSDAAEELIFEVQPKRESIVWQQNQLAEARYKLSPREQKLLLYVIAMIEPEAEDFGKCKVAVKDYAELTGLKTDDLYQELRDSALAIREKTLVVENVLEPGMKKPVRRHGSWFEYVDEAVGDGHITIKLSSWLRPLLIHVRREFFKYRLGYALGLKSEYAIRLYQWLKRWQFVRRKTASIQQLRLELGATEVDSEGKIIRENLAAYKHFKNKAILPAVKEINAKTDLSVSFAEEKTQGSKAVAGIMFSIKENLENLETLKPIALPEKPQMELSLDPVNVPTQDEVKPTLAELAREFGLSGSQETALQGYVVAEGLQYLLDKAEIVRSRPRSNAGQAFMAALKGDWQKPKTIDKKRPANKAAASANLHPEDAPKIDLDILHRTWIAASDQQRSDWLAAMPAQAQLFAPRPGQKPRTAFLATLGEIIAPSQEPVGSEA